MNSPMMETYRLTVEHFVSASDGSRIKIEDNKRFEFSFCNGSEREVYGERNHAIHYLMHRAENEMINDLKDDEND